MAAAERRTGWRGRISPTLPTGAKQARGPIARGLRVFRGQVGEAVERRRAGRGNPAPRWRGGNAEQFRAPMDRAGNASLILTTSSGGPKRACERNFPLSAIRPFPIDSFWAASIVPRGIVT